MGSWSRLQGQFERLGYDIDKPSIDSLIEHVEFLRGSGDRFSDVTHELLRCADSDTPYSESYVKGAMIECARHLRAVLDETSGSVWALIDWLEEETQDIE